MMRGRPRLEGVADGQLLELAEGRNSTAPGACFEARPESWRTRIGWAILDLAGSYRAALDLMLPHAVQVADSFHAVRIANQAPDECSRWGQNETFGHRGSRADPFCRARRRLTTAGERLITAQIERVLGLLAADDPHGDVRMAWNARKTLRRHHSLDPYVQ
ncbi:MAG: transposase [Actinomycetota bacterium]